jgi:hypothetical protein
MVVHNVVLDSFKVVVCSVEVWEYLSLNVTYVNYYHALTLKKYTMKFNSRDF